MKKLILLLCPLWLMAANDLSLVVKPGQPGFINANQVDVSQIAPGGILTLQVKLNNLDFTLAAAEFVVDFPQFLLPMRDTDADFLGANPPVSVHSDWGTTNLLILPVDETGNRNASHVSNEFGLVRLGVVFRDPTDRITGNGNGELILAELEFNLGNGSIPTCISADSQVRLVRCDTASPQCDYFADEAGQRVTMSGNTSALTVTLNHPGAAHTKGDMNGDGTVNFFDISPFLNCATAGQSDPGCPLSGLSTDDYVQAADINCDGGVNFFDINPFLKLATGSWGNFKTSDIDQKAVLAKDGEFTFDFEHSKGTMVLLEGHFRGAPVMLDDLFIEDPAWEIIEIFDSDYQRFSLVLVNSLAVDLPIPSLWVSYRAQAKGSGLVLEKALILAANGNIGPTPYNLISLEQNQD